MTTGRRRTERPLDLLAPPRDLQPFYVLMETPCPYLPGRLERKIMTQIRPPRSGALYSRLSRAGFRRSHNYAYRPACSRCTACLPIRVRVADFRPTGSLKRVQRANGHLRAEDRPPQATGEQYRLFAAYLQSRHGDGQMAGMTYDDYRAMVSETCLDTRVTEFREADGRLVAACLSDWLEDGPSAVYSFFDAEAARRSIGTYMVLWLIQAARLRGLPYVYLGYWIADSPKMAYKSRFQPAEVLGPEGWRLLRNGDR